MSVITVLQNPRRTGVQVAIADLTDRRSAEGSSRHPANVGEDFSPPVAPSRPASGRARDVADDAP